MLLSRDKFRESVFSRDNNTCVFCTKAAVDAHHILERRLFPDGGYYENNGASVCEDHHLECEMTILSVEEVREACGITKPVLPPHLYRDQVYDKWGNPVLEDGTRAKGELFNDPSVQKILKAGGVLDLFTPYTKYPRTYHLPWSPGSTKDDRTLENLSCFEGKEVVVTEKLDGENSTLYKDYLHARSINSGSHPSREWIKNFHATICSDIPDGWRLCGENMYAKHAIHYKNSLSSYFYLFSVWAEDNWCLSWDGTEEWANLLGLATPPVLYRGVFDAKAIQKLYTPTKENGDEMEGYVVRLASGFSYGDFRHSVAKFVRKNHILKTHGHWQRSAFVKNIIL